jgi:hypothetical protein
MLSCSIDWVPPKAGPAPLEIIGVWEYKKIFDAMGVYTAFSVS